MPRGLPQARDRSPNSPPTQVSRNPWPHVSMSSPHKQGPHTARRGRKASFRAPQFITRTEITSSVNAIDGSLHTVPAVQYFPRYQSELRNLEQDRNKPGTWTHVSFAIGRLSMQQCESPDKYGEAAEDAPWGGNFVCGVPNNGWGWGRVYAGNSVLFYFDHPRIVKRFLPNL